MDSNPIPDLDMELQPPIEDPNTVICGNCGVSGHRVIQCWKSRNGHIFGCGCCNSPTHNTAACASFPHDVPSQIDLIVTQRAQMPPLSSPPWFNILCEAVHEGLTIAHLQPLPWTPTFAMANPALTVPTIDPLTRDWQAARATHHGTYTIVCVLLYAAHYEEQAYRAKGRIMRSRMRPSMAMRVPGSVNQRSQSLVINTMRLLYQAREF